MTGYDDQAEIIKRCLQGDPAAQRRLYEIYRGKLMGICLRYARYPIDADDIFQESFIKVFNQLASLRKTEVLEGWIKRIVVHTAVNHYRANLKFYQQENLEQLERATSNDADALSRIDHQRLLELIQQLPDGYRMVFNMYVIDGFTHPEIAKMLGITEGTSKSQLSRAKDSLKIQLNKWGISQYESYG